MALPSTAFAVFSDTEGHWAESAVEKWSENGVLPGYPDGSFGPDNNITRGEFCALINRAFGFTESEGAAEFSDVSPTAWYANNIDIASAAGYLSGVGGGHAVPEPGITREQAFTIMGRVLELSQSSVPAPFSDMGNVSSWAVGNINTMAAGELISGADGKLEPGRSITRAEVAQLFDNAIKARFSEPGEYSGDVDGLAAITSTGVTLKDAVISGDLIIAESVGEGDAYLENVTVSGKLIIRGGGANSIILRGNTKISQGTQIVKKHARVAVRTMEYANAGDIEVMGTAVLSGSFGNVSISGENSTVVIEEGTYIETLYVSGDASNIVINGEVGRILVGNGTSDTNVNVGENGIVDEIITGSSLNITNNGEIGSLTSTNENVDNIVSGSTPGGGSTGGTNTNTGGGDSGSPTLTNAAAPVITMPNDVLVEINSASLPVLTPNVAVTDGGTLSYQWHVSATDVFSAAAAIFGATNQRYTPPADTDSVFYYFVVATNTNNTATGNKTATKVGGPVKVTVRDKQVGAAMTPVPGQSTTGDVKAATKSVSEVSGTISGVGTINDGAPISVIDDKNTAYTATVSVGIDLNSVLATGLEDYLAMQIAAAANSGVTIGSLYDISVRASDVGGLFDVTVTLTAKIASSETACIDSITLPANGIIIDDEYNSPGTDSTNTEASATFTMTSPNTYGILNFTFMTTPYSIGLTDANAGSNELFAATMKLYIDSLGGYTCAVNGAELTVTANTAVNGQQIVLSIP